MECGRSVSILGTCHYSIGNSIKYINQDTYDYTSNNYDFQYHTMQRNNKNK